MRTLRLWGMRAALLLGMGAAVVQAADREDRGRPAKPAAEASSKWGWMNPANWFGPKEKAKPAAKGKKDAKKDGAAKADAAPLPSPADEARGRRAREEADYFRRLEVCDQLREIAVRNEDHELLRRVDELTERAFNLYTQRTGARVPAGAAGLDAELREFGGVRDAEAAFRRRPAEEPIHTVTSGDRRPAVKEVDR